MQQLIFLNRKKFDISGPAGNAFVILGNVKSLLKQCKVDPELIDEWFEEATSGDYDNLINVCSEATGIQFVNGKGDSEWLN